MSQTADGAGTPAPSRSSVVFESVSVDYRGGRVLHDFSLAVAAGEFVALIGPSGSGKTTALRALAGFVRPSQGRLFIGPNDVTDTPPHARGLGLVVQNYALFPHMTVAENVAFGLRARRTDKATIDARVAETLEMVGMATYAKRLPRQLSGGQQQRVAIARALAVRPKVLLLDEPLSALDAQIRRAMVEELARLKRDLPDITTLYVTHDQSEALTLADRIGILRDGKLAALGESQALYRRPPNRFAAEFLGRANIFPVDVAAQRADGLVDVRSGATAFATTRSEGAVNGQAWLCVRPHALKAARGGDEPNRFAARVAGALWQGDRIDLTVEFAGQPLRLATEPSASAPAVGETIVLSFDPRESTLVPMDAA